MVAFRISLVVQYRAYLQFHSNWQYRNPRPLTSFAIKVKEPDAST